MGSQPSAYMFHNAAKMTHQQFQIGDDRPEPLRVASSPFNSSPAHQSAPHDPDFASDAAFAAKCNAQIDENLSIEELIVCVCEIYVDATISTTATRETTKTPNYNVPSNNKHLTVSLAQR